MQCPIPLCLARCLWLGPREGALTRCAGGKEVEDLNQMMSELEREDSGDDVEGHGDLLDDFVSSALMQVDSCNDTITVGYPFTPPMIPEAAAHDVLCILQVSTHKAPYKKLATVPESEGEDISSEGVSDDTASSLSDHSHADLHGDGLVSHGKRPGSSIASTYWRPQRTDRTEISSVLDDRCRYQDMRLPSSETALRYTHLAVYIHTSPCPGSQ